MGSSHGDFIKYPRTPHLFGSKGTSDDKHLDFAESMRFISDPSLIVEEKLDGTNVGIHFDGKGDMILQCRGHLINEGMHPQYDLFKQWAATKKYDFKKVLEDRFILFGEWLYAKHTIYYRGLSHYFQEFDIYDKYRHQFLSLSHRHPLIMKMGVQTVPILADGAISKEKLASLIGKSQFDSQFDNPETGVTDDLMEGLYLRTEKDGIVTGRAKFVRPEFVEKIKQSEHWQHQAVVPNLLKAGKDIWS